MADEDIQQETASQAGVLPPHEVLAQHLGVLARHGETERLLEHLDEGVPVDLADGSGNTLLMLAASYGHVATVTALLDRGADVDRLNEEGQSPLAGAVSHGHDQVIALLLTRGANPDAGAPSARATAEMFGRSLG